MQNAKFTLIIFFHFQYKMPTDASDTNIKLLISCQVVPAWSGLSGNWKSCPGQSEPGDNGVSENGVDTLWISPTYPLEEQKYKLHNDKLSFWVIELYLLH